MKSAFVTHTQFRPAPQWPNILLQSGVWYYQVPTSLWKRIHLTKKHSKDVGPMHFFKPSRKMNLYTISQTSFWATWREENFNFTLKVEGEKPGTEPSEGRELRQAICRVIKDSLEEEFSTSAHSTNQFRNNVRSWSTTCQT